VSPATQLAIVSRAHRDADVPSLSLCPPPQHRIEILTDAQQRYHYKLVSAEKVEKLRGLNPSEVVIYQHVEKSGNLGIWIKDLRRKSNLSALEVPKILKELEKRKLIKCEKSIQATNKKVYMLYDIEPAREITGGVWYNSQGEFDTEYMRTLEDTMMMLLQKKADKRLIERERISHGVLSSTLAVETGSASAAEIEAFLLGTGAFKTVPSEEETTKILEGLVYEGRVEKQEDEAADWLRLESQAGKIRPSTAAGAAASSSSSAAVDPTKKRRREAQATYVYRVVSAGSFQSAFQAIPCATCPVAKSCHEGNPISPQSCVYLKEWLAF
jgi:DNA-directed RNA polymerase III subunit RPC6